MGCFSTSTVGSGMSKRTTGTLSLHASLLQNRPYLSDHTASL